MAKQSGKCPDCGRDKNKCQCDTKGKDKGKMEKGKEKGKKK